MRLVPASSIRVDLVKKQVQSFINHKTASLECESELVGWKSDPSLAQNVDMIWVAESGELLGNRGGNRRRWPNLSSAPPPSLPSLSYVFQASGESIVETRSSTLVIHVWKPDPTEQLLEFSAADPNAERDEDSDVSAATVSELPSKALDGIWDK